MELMDMAWHRVSRDVYTVETGPQGCEQHIQTYIIVGPERRTIIIDPGPRTSAERILDTIPEMGFSPKDVEAIILTHVHLDHGGGAAALAKMLGGRVPIMVHPVGYRHVIDPSRLWQASRELLGDVAELYGKPDDAYGLDVRELQDSSTQVLGGVRLKIIYTPGHASHHLSIYAEELGMLFVGDAAGIYIVDEDLLYPTTPPPFRYQQYLSSLEKLQGLEPEVVAFPHEGARFGHSILARARRQIVEWFELVSRGSEGVEDMLKVEAGLRKHLEGGRSDMCKKVENRLLELTLKGLREEATRPSSDQSRT